ncbi:hypothetical protein IW262DRAFT_1466455 [Armillaria fumosa]|nr:hypothetical protein IW262DRAFT_1466455 [Armillaria fumosa]
MPHIPIPNDVAQPTTSFGTLTVTSSLQNSFSGNIFKYDDSWTAVGMILGLEFALSTPAKDVDNLSTLLKLPLKEFRFRVVILQITFPLRGWTKTILTASLTTFISAKTSRTMISDDLDNQGIHDIPAHVHQNSSPSLLHLESHLPSVYFSSSNDYFNNLAGSPVADEEGKDVNPLFDCNAPLDDSNSDCHSQPDSDEEDYADPEDTDGYTSFETSSWAIYDAHQCVEEPIPDNYKQPSGVSARYRSSSWVPAQSNIQKDDLHVAQYTSSNASASSSPHSQAHRSPCTSHHSPTNAFLGLLNDAQLAALPITIRTNTPSSDSLARHAQIVQDPKPAIEPAPTPAPELTDEIFSADKIIHSAHSPASVCRDESVEAIAPQAFTGFSLFSKDDFLEEPDSDD